MRDAQGRWYELRDDVRAAARQPVMLARLGTALEVVLYEHLPVGSDQARKVCHACCGVPWPCRTVSGVRDILRSSEL